MFLKPDNNSLDYNEIANWWGKFDHGESTKLYKHDDDDISIITSSYLKPSIRKYLGLELSFFFYKNGIVFTRSEKGVLKILELDDRSGDFTVQFDYNFLFKNFNVLFKALVLRLFNKFCQENGLTFKKATIFSIEKIPQIITNYSLMLIELSKIINKGENNLNEGKKSLVEHFERARTAYGENVLMTIGEEWEEHGKKHNWSNQPKVSINMESYYISNKESKSGKEALAIEAVFITDNFNKQPSISFTIEHGTTENSYKFFFMSTIPHVNNINIIFKIELKKLMSNILSLANIKDGVENKVGINRLISILSIALNELQNIMHSLNKPSFDLKECINSTINEHIRKTLKEELFRGGRIANALKKDLENFQLFATINDIHFTFSDDISGAIRERNVDVGTKYNSETFITLESKKINRIINPKHEVKLKLYPLKTFAKHCPPMNVAILAQIYTIIKNDLIEFSRQHSIPLVLTNNDQSPLVVDTETLDIIDYEFRHFIKGFQNKISSHLSVPNYF
jgi:hypothetical protein